MGSMSVQPICALNPYNNNWKIKAKIIKKESKRSYNNNGSQASVFTIEIVDDQVFVHTKADSLRTKNRDALCG